MSIREELHIDCSPATAFDLMADVRKLPLWNEGASRAELKSDEPIGQGSRFIAVNRGQEMESTITTFDRPNRLDFSTSGKLMDAASAFHFAEAGTGTALVIELDPHPKGVMKVLLPVLSPLIRRDLVRQHLNFKEFCESQSQSHDA